MQFLRALRTQFNDVMTSVLSLPRPGDTERLRELESQLRQLEKDCRKAPDSHTRRVIKGDMKIIQQECKVIGNRLGNAGAIALGYARF